jgi:putative ABC transport system substrate-binding protein
MIARRKLLIALGAGAVAAPLAAFAQRQPAKIPRVAYVSGRSGPPDPSADAVRQGLRDLGYVEGKNILFEARYYRKKLDRTAELAAELGQLKADVLVSATMPVILAARQASATVPIVIVSGADPVKLGLVDSLARPGGNITGISRLTRELGGKRLELLKEVIPGLARVAVLRDVSEPATDYGFKEYESAARTLKTQLLPLEVRPPKPDLEGAFQAATKGRAGALVTIRNTLLLDHSRQIANLAIKHRLPSMYEGNEFIEAGGLISYSSNDTASFKRAAVFVDKILKGAKPADLPIEQATEFELAINLKTAKAIGLAISKDFMLRAHKVIE